MTKLRLVSRAQTPGGQESFAELYQARFDFVWCVLARLGVPERDLADAAQDVFVVVHRKLPEFDGSCRVTTWLYGICSRVASTRRRAAPARNEVLEAAPPEQGGIQSDALAADTAHYRRLLAEALDGMPLEQRAVFAFYEFDGMTGPEIAEYLGVPEGTVHSRLRLAREIFRRFVERQRAREASRSGKQGEPK